MISPAPTSLPPAHAEASAHPARSQTVHLVGTPAYLAPEQWQGLRASARSDQYAFCVALYEALVGEKPFTATDLPGLRAQIIGTPVDCAHLPVPRHQRLALARGLAKMPSARFASMTELLAALAHARGPGYASPQRLGPLVAVGLLGVGLAIYAWPTPPTATLQTACATAGEPVTAALYQALPPAQTALAAAGYGDTVERNQKLGQLVDRWHHNVVTSVSAVCRNHGGPQAPATTLATRCYAHQTNILARALHGLTAPSKHDAAYLMKNLARLSQSECGMTPETLMQWEDFEHVHVRALENATARIVIDAVFAQRPHYQALMRLADFASAVGAPNTAVRAVVYMSNLAPFVAAAPDAPTAAYAERYLAVAEQRGDMALKANLLDTLSMIDGPRITEWQRTAKEFAIRTGNFELRMNIDIGEAFSRRGDLSPSALELRRRVVDAAIAHMATTQQRPWDLLQYHILGGNLARDGSSFARQQTALTLARELFGEHDLGTFTALDFASRAALRSGHVVLGKEYLQNLKALATYWEAPATRDTDVGYVEMVALRAEHNWPELLRYAEHTLATADPSKLKNLRDVARLHRGLALQALGRPREAINDLTYVTSVWTAWVPDYDVAQAALAQLQHQADGPRVLTAATARPRTR